MTLPDLSVTREFSAERINAVINHPEVRPFVGAKGQGFVDATTLVADPRNYLLMGEGGGFVLQCLEPSVYEVHTQFLPEARGKNVLRATIDMQRYMFARTDCLQLLTKVPGSNPAATALTRRGGGKYLFHASGAAHYGKSFEDWASEAIAGQQACASLLQPLMAEPAQINLAGLALELIAFGQIGKGLGLYNRMARFAGFSPLTIIADNPPVLDIGSALVALRNETYEVILCR